MPEDIFRLVVTAAVLLASIAFLVQAVTALAFYRMVRKMQQKVDDLAVAAAPLMGQIGPVIEKVGPIIDQAAPIVGRLGPMIDRTTDTMERMRPVIDRTVEVIGKIGVVVEEAGPVIEGARRVLASANQVVVDTRPRINEFSDEALAAARSGRAQVERIGDLLNDAGERARARLEQIDQSVEHTVQQVGNVGDAMKRAVMRPVREANGLAAGLSAAVSTLVRPRKASPDAATQDEEMFI